MSQNEKKGTRRKAYSSKEVVRRSPSCRIGDDGLDGKKVTFIRLVYIVLHFLKQHLTAFVDLVFWFGLEKTACIMIFFNEIVLQCRGQKLRKILLNLG